MPTGLWTDYKASSFNGGNGTSTNPYQIATSYFKLTADID